MGAINTYQLHRLGRDVTQIGSGMTQLNQAVGAMSENLAEVKLAVGTIGESVDGLLAATNHLIALSAGTMFLSYTFPGVVSHLADLLRRPLISVSTR